MSIDKKTVFRYNEYRNVTSLDPAFARNPQNIWPINQLFNGLVQLDSMLNIQPEIAKKWTISDDGMTYTFELRQDVFFSFFIPIWSSTNKKSNRSRFCV